MEKQELGDFYTDLSLVEDPRPFLESVRTKGRVEPLPNRNVVALTGYEEAVAVYADIDHFSSVNSITGPLPDLPFAPDGDDISEQIEVHRSSMPFAMELAALDGPDHQRFRSLLMKLFTPKKLKQLDEQFRATARQLIEEFADQGHVEFVSAFAYPFGALVITDLLGIPAEERAQFSKYLGGTPAGPIGLSDRERQVNPLVGMAYKLAAYISARREKPQKDLLTEFATATYADGSMPTVEEATRLACFLFGAGQDTTAKAISASLRILGEQPALQDLLRQDPDRIPDFVEEVLRCEGSIKTTHRLCKRTTEVAGVTIKAGTTVMISNMAANSDPSRFDRPQDFEIDRPRRKEHLAFGRGAHTCVGAPLARAEIRMSIECMLGAFENLRLDTSAHGGPDGFRYHYEPSYIMRGLEELHLTFDRRSPD